MYDYVTFNLFLYDYVTFNLFMFQFIAHPNCQQLLASLWYEGLPGFRRQNIVSRTLLTLCIAMSFPVLSIFYLIAPKSFPGNLLRKPFIKFMCHSTSYLTFLGLYINKRLENTKGAIKNRHSRETGNIGYTRRRHQKKYTQHNMCWTSLYTNKHK